MRKDLHDCWNVNYVEEWSGYGRDVGCRASDFETVFYGERGGRAGLRQFQEKYERYAGLCCGERGGDEGSGKPSGAACAVGLILKCCGSGGRPDAGLSGESSENSDRLGVKNSRSVFLTLRRMQCVR